MSSTPGVFGSASKKDSIEKRAGELAANLFEKFKHKKTPNAPATLNTSTPSTSSTSSSSTPANNNAIPQSSSFSSLLAAAVEANQSSNSTSSLIQNLAISFHKNVMSNQNSNAAQSSNSSSTGVLAAAPGAKTANSLVIIEDDSYDDDESTFDYENAVKSQPTFKTSQSDFNIKHGSDILNSSETNLNSGPTDNNEAKLTASSSLYSDLAHTASIEADSLRKRFQTKKKSIELSFENIKNKVIKKSN